MLDRGWHENTNHNSGAFDLKYCLKMAHINKTPLLEHQQVNHFFNTTALTTKVGIANSLKSHIWWSNNHQLEEFFPRCYDVTDGLEIDEFKGMYKYIRA
jgi:hypothetical protein